MRASRVCSWRWKSATGADLRGNSLGKWFRRTAAVLPPGVSVSSMQLMAAGWRDGQQQSVGRHPIGGRLPSKTAIPQREKTPLPDTDSGVLSQELSVSEGE